MDTTLMLSKVQAAITRMQKSEDPAAVVAALDQASQKIAEVSAHIREEGNIPADLANDLAKALEPALAVAKSFPVAATQVTPVEITSPESFLEAAVEQLEAAANDPVEKRGERLAALAGAIELLKNWEWKGSVSIPWYHEATTAEKDLSDKTIKPPAIPTGSIFANPAALHKAMDTLSTINVAKAQAPSQWPMDLSTRGFMGEGWRKR